MAYNNRNSADTQPVDYGPGPLVINIDNKTVQNPNYRSTLWTGDHLQVTLMSILGELGLESHPYLDQFLKIEEGSGVAMLGDKKDNLNHKIKVTKGDAIVIPAGTWHNLINQGSKPLKLYSVYAPIQHPHGTVQRTKAEADAAESNMLLG